MLSRRRFEYHGLLDGGSVMMHRMMTFAVADKMALGKVAVVG